MLITIDLIIIPISYLKQISTCNYDVFTLNFPLDYNRYLPDFDQGHFEVGSYFAVEQIINVDDFTRRVDMLLVINLEWEDWR